MTPDDLTLTLTFFIIPFTFAIVTIADYWSSSIKSRTWCCIFAPVVMLTSILWKFITKYTTIKGVSGSMVDNVSLFWKTSVIMWNKTIFIFVNFWSNSIICLWRISKSCSFQSTGILRVYAWAVFGHNFRDRRGPFLVFFMPIRIPIRHNIPKN